MNRGLSLWLDVLRAGATLLVVFSHFAYPRFSHGTFQWMRDYNFGSDAVVVFFVVSGFVIAFAAGRDQDANTYAFNRLTRLWSVLLPALALTIIFDRIGIAIDPTAYPRGFYEAHSVTDMFLRGASFSNEFGGLGRMRLGSNGPLWSLSYEAAYYALFGIAVFLTGARRAILLAVVEYGVGVPILMLMPAWLMGVYLFHLVKTDQIASVSARKAVVFAIGGPLAYAVMQIIGLPDRLLAVSTALFGVNMNIAFAFSDEFVWNGIIGVLTVIHIIGMARLMQDGAHDSVAVRWIAGASFSLYVTHYPALHLLNATLPDVAGREVIMLFGSLAVGFVFAEVFERRIKGLRQILRSAITAFNPPKAKALDSTTST